VTTRAVFFDVDFTLIHPGPTFQGEGYGRFCAKHGMGVDPSAFDRAVADASVLLDEMPDHIYDPELFIAYTKQIIAGMGGSGPALDACAREMYEQWAVYQHFTLYEDVEPVFRTIATSGIRIGLISNTHRCLESFQQHFELDGLISGVVSSSEHGYLKPHPSIFRAALRLLDVAADEAVMVGDSPKHDVEGARRVGMRAVLLRRSGRSPANPLAESTSAPLPDGVPIIRGLRDLAPLL
jgi:putative hydrolase of the HAD superfamily